MKYSIKVDQAIRDIVSQWSDETLLAYVTCPNYRAEDMSEINDSYLMFLHPNTLETSKQAIQTLRSQIQHPILVASDMEAGPGTAIFGATTFPSMRAVAETKRPQLAYEMGKIAALEAREIGYNWTFAPCVDILGNHFSPITSIRSAGEDVKDVIGYTTQYMKGLQDHGLIATAKHFPGDGYSTFDQHLTTAINPLSKEEWDQSFRLVYQNIINEGVRAMMPGHIALPCYDEIDPKTGLFPPATLSSSLLTRLLKQDLGFEGLIISDATEMSDFCGYMNFYDACARFLMSGGDVLLFAHPNPTFIAEMKKRMQTGQLTKDVLIDRVCRILAFCQDYVSITYPLHFHLAEHQQIADEVVRQSVRIYRDRHQILPIRMHHPKIAHVVIAQQIQMQIVQDFTSGLKQYAEVSEFIDPGCGKIKAIAQSGEYDYIVVTIGCTQWYGTNQITLSGTIARNMMNGWTKYNTPVIFVDFGNPYIHEEYDPLIDTLIYTYGYAAHTIECVLCRIFQNQQSKE